MKLSWLFGGLLRKASAPVHDVTKASPAVAPSITDRDKENHERKRHYNYQHEADNVVRRTVEQNPFRSQNLHSYHCPICKQAGKRGFLVGHKPLTTR